MRAVVVSEFGQRPHVRSVPDPVPADHGAVIRVEATGLCRSDWHGWMGHDPDIALPYVPGHEFAGVVAAVGSEVQAWRVGDRVTMPFVSACGSCPACRAGQHQVCLRQTQPGFTHDGSFAEYVPIDHADVNLVGLPDALDFTSAAALGCRVATAYRAVAVHGRVGARDVQDWVAGDWLAVHGCGGVGLSAVLIGKALGARVVAVDVSPAALDLARDLGAEVCIDARDGTDTAAAVREATGGGARVSLDAYGSEATCAASIEGLRWRGRHVQVGLLPSRLGRPALPMDRVVALELEVLGSHGLAARDYPPLLDLVASGQVPVDRLVTGTLALDQAPDALMALGSSPWAGTRVIAP